jgi:hypothetical protein
MLRNNVIHHTLLMRIFLYINVTLSPIHTNTLIYKNKMRLQTGDEQVTFRNCGDVLSPAGAPS